MEEDEDGRVDDPNESPSKAPAPQHPPGNPLASGAAQHPAVRACDAKFMSYVDHFNKANPGFQSTAAPSEGSWTFNPQPIGPSQQQTAPLPSPAAQPTVISAIAAPAREQIVIPRNWTPSHQRIYTGNLERTEEERQMDTLYVINNPPPSSHARNIINNMVPQRELLIKPPRGANRAADLVYDVKEKNKRRYGEANVGYIYGQEAPTPCTRCAKDGGRYAYCVTMADYSGKPYFFGSCTNCRAQDDTRQCSLANPPPVKRGTDGAGGGNSGGGSGGSGGSGGVGGGVAGLSTGTFSLAFNSVSQQPSRDVEMEDYENPGTTTPESTQYTPSNSSSAELWGQITPGSSSANSTGMSSGLNFGPQAGPEYPVNSNPRGQAVYWKHVIDTRAASQNTGTVEAQQPSGESIADEDEPMGPKPGDFGLGGKGWW